MNCKSKVLFLLIINFVSIHRGESGIRTRDTLLRYTHFPGVRLQPLGHLSFMYYIQNYSPKNSGQKYTFFYFQTSEN